MHSTKTIQSLTLVASLAAGITIVSASQGAFAGCAPRDHRTNCDAVDPNDHRTRGSGSQGTPVNFVGGNNIILSSSRVVGKNADGSPKWKTTNGTNAGENTLSTNRTVERLNKDGSADVIQQLRQPDGSWEDWGVVKHIPPRTPKSVNLQSCPFWGC